MTAFMLGIMSILTTDLFTHFFGLCFAVCSAWLLYHAVHIE